MSPEKAPGRRRIAPHGSRHRDPHVIQGRNDIHPLSRFPRKQPGEATRRQSHTGSRAGIVYASRKTGATSLSSF